MKAFIEFTSGVIRSGPDCDSYGKPFDYAVAFSSVDGKTAVIKGLHKDMPPRAHLRAGIAALRRAGFKPKFVRFKKKEAMG